MTRPTPVTMWALAFWSYLWYVLRHKWFVFLECRKHGLFRRGLIHDWSKFRSSEFGPYMRHFAPGIQHQRDKTGYYKPYQTGDDAFDRAWLLHMHRNAHHWQFWCQPKGDGMLHVYRMPTWAVQEMIADWYGASRTQRVTGTVLDWYTVHRDDMQLHPVTRAQVEETLGYRVVKVGIEVV